MVPERFYLQLFSSAGLKLPANWIDFEDFFLLFFGKLKNEMNLKKRFWATVCVHMCVGSFTFFPPMGWAGVFTSSKCFVSFQHERDARVKQTSFPSLPAFPIGREHARRVNGGETATRFHTNFHPRAAPSVMLRHLCLSIHPVKCEPFVVNPLLPSF